MSPIRHYTSSATASRRQSGFSRRAPRPRLHTHRGARLDSYRTSYWKEQWGFCMSRRQLDSLEDGDYHVMIDADLEGGSLTSARSPFQEKPRRSFFSAPTSATPALANDNTVWDRAALVACTDTRYAAAQAHLPAPLEPGHARAALLARSQSRKARPRPTRAGRVVCRRSGAAAIQMQSPGRLARRPCGDICAESRCGEHRHGLAADWRRRATVLRSRVQPACRYALADTARTLP